MTPDDFEGLTESDVDRFLSGTAPTDDPVDDDDIDRVLYEDEAAPE